MTTKEQVLKEIVQRFPNSDDLILVFDMTEMKPACAILQAQYFGHPQVASLFDSRIWLTNPTPDMKAYKITPEQLADVVVKMEDAYPDGKPK